jgi:hypothetical protein
MRAEMFHSRRFTFNSWQIRKGEHQYAACPALAEDALSHLRRAKHPMPFTL